MDHQPLVNAIIDVLLNENEIRSTAYTPATPDFEDRKVSVRFHENAQFLPLNSDW